MPPLTILQGFWEIFHPRLQAAQTTAGYVPRADRPPPQPTTHTCPACGQDILVRRAGPTGEFLSCARYPQCKYTQPPDQPVPATLPPCPQCKGKLIPRTGANGPFLACSRYPKCKYTEEIEHEPA